MQMEKKQQQRSYPEVMFQLFGQHFMNPFHIYIDIFSVTGI